MEAYEKIAIRVGANTVNVGENGSKTKNTIRFLNINPNKLERPIFRCFYRSPRDRRLMNELDSIKDGQGAVSNLIALLNALDKIEVTDERIEKNSKSGVCNDGIVINY